MESQHELFLEKLAFSLLEKLSICEKEEERCYDQRKQMKIEERKTKPTKDGNERDFLVNEKRILEGLDIRTTFMIRNIPSKYTQAMLKEVLDSVCFGRYNFLYLVFDFVTECNFGYAFINFVSAEDVLLFIRIFGEKRWELFNSEKRCSVCYAKIQGLNILIEKFRYSKVMLEKKEYRPSLFYTEGEKKGREKHFPS